MKFENVRVYNFENALRGMRNPLSSWHHSDSLYGIINNEQTVLDLCKEMAKTYYPNDYTQHDVDAIFKDAILYKNGSFVEYAIIGPKDMKLAQRLIKGGSEHRKFLRQIFVSVDITAPLYWWKEFDTYKIGTVANSTSTMHTIHKEPITINNFEIDDYDETLELIDPINLGVRVNSFIDDLEQLRQLYLQYKKEAKDTTDPIKRKKLNTIAKKYWKELVRWTPDSWLQTRTVTMNYENLLSIYLQRNSHKLNEWSGMDNLNLDNFIKFIKEEIPYSSSFIFIDETTSEKK